MKLELNENLIEEILAVDAEFNNLATDDTFEHAADLIGVLAEKINEQK